MSNSRRNKCDGRLVDISSTHIPTITPSGNDDDGCSSKSFLVNHMAEGHITTGAANLILDVMNNAKLYQTQDALIPGDEGFYRYGNAHHGPPGSMYAELPIAVDTPEARSVNNKFLAMVSNYGRRLKVPEHNTDLTKVSCRGYEAEGGVGGHNDYRGVINKKKHNLRACLGAGAEKIITLSFHQPNKDPEKEPTTYYLPTADESEKKKKPSIVVKKFQEGFSFYGMSEFASGIRSLCFDGEKNVIVKHAIRVGNKRHVTVVIDYYFDTMDQLMEALRIMEEVPMHADFSDEANALSCILGHQNNIVQDTTLPIPVAAKKSGKSSSEKSDRKRKALPLDVELKTPPEEEESRPAAAIPSNEVNTRKKKRSRKTLNDFWKLPATKEKEEEQEEEQEENQEEKNIVIDLTND